MSIIDTFKGYIGLYNGHRESGNIEEAVTIGQKLVRLAEDELKRPNTPMAYKDFYKATSDKVRAFLQEVSSGAYANRRCVAGNGEGEEDFKDRNWFSEEIPSETLADLIGLQDLRDQLLVNLLAPLSPKYSAIYQKYRRAEGLNILLWGPPGTGKTFTAKCISGTLKCHLCVLKISDLLCRYVGDGASAIAAVFEQASKLDRAVIVLDEIDSIGSARGSDQARHSQEQLLSLLTHLDGFSSKTKPGQVRVVIACTNVLPSTLDSALTRGGRFFPLYVGMPDAEARTQFIARAWGKDGKGSSPDVPLAADVSPEWLSSRLEGYAGADIQAICFNIANIPLMREIKHFAATGEELNDHITRADCETVISNYANPVSDDQMLRYDAFRASMEYDRYLQWYEPRAREARERGEELPLHVINWLASLDNAGPDARSPRYVSTLERIADRISCGVKEGAAP